MFATERRQEERKVLDIPAQLLGTTAQKITTPLDANIEDISNRGLKIRVWHDAPIGARFSLSLASDNDDSLCMAEVVWKRDSTKGMIYGLRVNRWTYLSDRLAAKINPKKI